MKKQKSENTITNPSEESFDYQEIRDLIERSHADPRIQQNLKEIEERIEARKKAKLKNSN